MTYITIPDAPTRWRTQLQAWTAPSPEAAPAAPGGDGWVHHADRFRALNQTVRGRDEPFLTFLARWLAPGARVLDVGAGGGRYALPLAEQGVSVCAVEPSPAMRAVLTETAAERGLSLDIVPLAWPAAVAEVESADVVICANVLYDVQELAPFVAALDQAARRAVAISLTLKHPVGYLGSLWKEFRGWEVPAGPHYLDAAAVVYSLGIACQVSLLPVQPTLRLADREAAVAFYRQRLGMQPDTQRDARLREAIGPLLSEQEGELVGAPYEHFSAVIWWEKETRDEG